MQFRRIPSEQKNRLVPVQQPGSRPKQRPTFENKVRQLRPEDCDVQWAKVSECLQGVAGLERRGEVIVATSWLKEDALGPLAEAIGVLAEADCPLAACALMRMCKPSLRWALVQMCGPDHIARLRMNDRPEVREAFSRVLSAAASHALKHGNLALFFHVLPWCSAEERRRLEASLPSLTRQWVPDLDDAALVEALRVQLERMASLPLDDGLAEWEALLSIADDPKVCGGARAALMKCILWSDWDSYADALEDAGGHDAELAALRPLASLPRLTAELLDSLPPGRCSEALRIAVEQAANAQDIEEGLGRLVELAKLSPGLPGPLASVLRHGLDQAVTSFILHRDLDLVPACESLILKVRRRQGQQPAILRSVTQSAQRIIGTRPLTDPLIECVQGFRLCCASGRLKEAAKLIASCPSPASREILLPALLERVKQRLLEVGIEILNLEIRQFHPVLASEARRRVAEEMAVVLFLTAERFYVDVAGALLLEVSAEPNKAQKRAGAIRVLLDGLEVKGETPILQIIRVLTNGWEADAAPEIDFILAVGGEQWVSKAVELYLMSNTSSSVIVGSLFDKLAHRVDLLTQLKSEGEPFPITHLKGVPVVKPKHLKDCASRMAGWAPGWKWLLLKSLNKSSSGSRWGLATEALMRTAEQASSGKPAELIEVLLSLFQIVDEVFKAAVAEGKKPQGWIEAPDFVHTLAQAMISAELCASLGWNLISELPESASLQWQVELAVLLAREDRSSISLNAERALAINLVGSPFAQQLKELFEGDAWQRIEHLAALPEDAIG